VRHPGNLKASAARRASLARPSGWVVNDKQTRHGEERGITWLTDGAHGK
jgi:hypothetical protein